MSPGRDAFWLSGFWHRRSRVVNLKSRLEGLLRLLLWACGQRSCVVQAQRHVHSATGSGISAGFTGSSQAFPVEVNPVGVMDQAVEDSVGVGGVADQWVPLIDGDLAGDDGGAVAVAVLEDLQEVVAGPGGERLEAPVVEGEEVGATERAQETGGAAAAPRPSQVGGQTRGAPREPPADFAARPRSPP